MPVWLGLDLGEKRVGVAMAETSTAVATPLTTVVYRNRTQLAAELVKIIKDHGIEKIIVGLPTTLKGNIGPAAQKVMALAEWLKEKTGIPVVYWDERLSTQEVEKVLLEAHLSRKRRKAVRDRLAAQRILQNYLDRWRHRDENNEV